MRGLRSAAFLVLVPLLGTAQVPVRDQRPAQPAGDSTITGRVTTAEGRPLARARVMLRSTGSAPPISTGGRASGPGLWQQMTDATGEYTFARLPAGTYVLSATHNQYLSAQYGQQFIGQPGRPIELAAGQTLRANLTAVRGAAVTGRVFDETGEPIADVSVMAYRYAMTGTRRQLVPVGGRTYASNDIGQYRIANLPPGDYLIAAQYRGQPDPSQQEAGVRAGYAPTYYPGSVTPSTAQAVRVRPGNDAANIDFVLQPARLVTVSGSIVTSSGEPAQGTQLFVTTVDAELAATTRVGTRVMPNGTFTVADLTPGEYLFAAQRPVGMVGPAAGGGRGEPPARGGGPPSSPRREMEYGTLKVNVAGAPIDNVTIYLRPGAKIRVRVESDVPLPGGRMIMLAAEEPPGMSQSMAISGDGEAVLHAGPGRYRVTASGLPAGWIIERVTAGARDITISGLVVTDAPVDVVVRASSQGATLTGSAMTMTASSPVDYSLVLLSENAAARTGAGGGVRMARADQQGQFIMRGLRAGSYYAVALDYVDPNELYDAAFWARVEPNAVRVTLSAGETKQISAPFISRR